MTPATVEILTNDEVIAVNQDPLGIQAFKHASDDSLEFWFKPLADGAWAMAVLNRRATPATFSFDWAAEHVEDPHFDHAAGFGTTTYRLRDLWAHEERGTTATPLDATVPPHDVLMLRLTPQ